MQFKGEGIYSGLQFKVTVHHHEEDMNEYREGMVAGRGEWLITLHPQSEK